MNAVATALSEARSAGSSSRAERTWHQVDAVRIEAAGLDHVDDQPRRTQGVLVTLEHAVERGVVLAFRVAESGLAALVRSARRAA